MADAILARARQSAKDIAAFNVDKAKARHRALQLVTDDAIEWDANIGNGGGFTGMSLDSGLLCALWGLLHEKLITVHGRWVITTDAGSRRLSEWDILSATPPGHVLVKLREPDHVTSYGAPEWRSYYVEVVGGQVWDGGRHLRPDSARAFAAELLSAADWADREEAKRTETAEDGEPVG